MWCPSQREIAHQLWQRQSSGYGSYEKAPAVQTRWSSFENLKAERGRAARENKGAKGHAFDRLAAGERKTLLDVDGSGIIHRIWLTISDRSPEVLRGL